METRDAWKVCWWPLLLAVVLLLAGCGAAGRTATPIAAPTCVPQIVTAVPPTATEIPPTPTYGRGYIPPETRRAMPTSTYPPTPTPTPVPYYPRRTLSPGGFLPSLPADLFFLRDGRLWRWPAGGEALEALSPAEGPGAEPILDYRLTPDGTVIAYLTASGRLFVLDRSVGEAILVPTLGELGTEFNERGLLSSDDGSGIYLDQFDLTSDGRYLVYLAWGIESGDLGRVPGLAAALLRTRQADLSSGTLYAVDVRNPGQQAELGRCAARQDDDWRVGCSGFLLSPDGRQVTYFDGEGMWVAQIPEGEPRNLAERFRPVKSDNPKAGALWRPYQWSADGRALLVHGTFYEATGLVAVDIASGQVWNVPGTCFSPDCCVHGAWGLGGVWVAEIGPGGGAGPASPWQGCISFVQMTGGETLEIATTISRTGSGPLWPTALHPLPEGQLLFAHQGFADSGGQQSGIFALHADGTLNQVARLPVFVRPPYKSILSLCYSTSVMWSSDGAAFLYLVGPWLDVGMPPGPVALGFSDGSELWDVQAVLQRAHRFHWAAPAATGP